MRALTPQINDCVGKPLRVTRLGRRSYQQAARPTPSRPTSTAGRGTLGSPSMRALWILAASTTVVGETTTFRVTRLGRAEARPVVSASPPPRPRSRPDLAESRDAAFDRRRPRAASAHRPAGRGPRSAKSRLWLWVQVAARLGSRREGPALGGLRRSGPAPARCR